jgi:murein DD-endopeptidase MepM/ murein hydrolase activator NlpD
MRRFVIALLVGGCASAPPPPASPKPPPAALEPPFCPQAEATPAFATADQLTKELVARMNARDAKGVFALYSHAMQEQFPLGVTTELVETTIGSRGKITDFARKEGDEHNALYTLKAERGEWRLSLHIDDAGRIFSMRLSDAPPPEPPLAESTPVALPIRGKWLVAWGGARAEDNPHVSMNDQRRAADLVLAGADGKHFKTDGKKNDDYLAYGQEVLAVADGSVVTVVDGIPENAPGPPDSVFGPGNMVIVDHGKGLYSMAAHLQPGKMKVKPGQKVKAGAALALVGNSGNSSEPHLHIQLMDGPRVETAWGLDGVFANVAVTRDGKTEKTPRYTFRRGDVVEPQGR